MLVFVCFMSLFAQCLSQIIGPGPCPQPKPIPNFNDTKLIGQWFEWARTDSTYQDDHVCGILTYYMGDDGNMVEHYDGIIRSSGAWLIWEGRMIPAGNPLTAQYDMKFSEYSRDKDFKATFVAANFDHWVILHGCKERGDEASQFVWIWAKNYDLEQQYQDEIRNALENNNLPTQNLSIVDQTNCPNHD